ncbi:TPA: thiamine phosphate synthase [Streptococcus pneumoniae]
MQEFTNPFPIGSSSLIHCITNEISCEMLANGILALGCKPVMADDSREVLDFTKQSQALFINLGHLSAEKEKAIRMAASYANQSSLPMVVDAVGVTTSSIRKSLVKDLLDYRPTVLKGNMSEIRSLVGLKHHGVGVDASAKDQETEDLLQVLKDWCQTYPGMSFLVTGPKDLVVSKNQVAVLGNGCTELDWITGTGDLVGALTAVFLSLRLYLVTNRYQDSVESFLAKVETACRSGVTIVQLREKNLTTNQYYQLAKQVKEITDAYQVPLIIDDRLDVCLAVDAAGLHIGDDELPVSVARKVLGPEKILGVTAKTVKRALEAEKSGADYLGTGAIFPTTTKENAPITLISTLKTICQTVAIPVVAIGGLTSENIDQLMGTGIAGVAVVRDLMQAEDIEAKTQAFLKKLHNILS